MKKRVIICFVCVVFIFSVINISALSTLETPTKVYNISLKSVDSNSAYITINNINSPRLTIQNSPYYLNYSVEGLYLIVKDVHSAQYAGDISRVTLLIAIETNLTEECYENWNCSNWSACSNNQQTRICTDLSSCGTVKDKPAENQSCASPNQLQNPVLPPTPKINCTNDIDCLVDGTGMPECKNNERCIPFISSKCINPGTSQSYCNNSLAERCTPCPNGCQNNQCINKPQPVKECETIGLRESGKYCSSQYKWANQKEDGILCENNFECKINSCFESKCSKEQTSQIAYWTGGALAIVIILFLIIYLRAKKQ